MSKHTRHIPFPSEPLVRKIVENPPLLYAGIRKIAQGITWEVDSIPSVTYEGLGYSKNKLKQLQRNYIDPEEFERVRQILAKRRDKHFTSVALLMRGAKKDSRSMGWCMLNLVVTRGPKIENVEVHYRSTEVILKFGADLAFLPSVFEQLDVHPQKVTFRFANAFLSGVYFPTLCAWWPPVDFLEYLFEHDIQMFKGATRFFLRSAYKEDQRFPYSPENMQHKFAWRVLGPKKMRQIRDYLHEKHKKFGKPLPTQHHSREEDDE